MVEGFVGSYIGFENVFKLFYSVRVFKDFYILCGLVDNFVLDLVR